MAFSQLFATRMIGLESLFGGLDRIYIIHKWIGIIAMAAILLHDTIDAEIDEQGNETWLVDLAETLGEFSLYSLLILVVISLFTVIPYPLWRFTHKFMGTLFAFSSFHYAFMLKPFTLTDPLGIYILSFCILGMLCYLITLLPFSLLAGRYQYQVSAIDQTGGATAISLTTRSKGLKHISGQFCFISLQQSALRETHPFTLSSAPVDNRQLRFTIKALGDYSASVAKSIKLGDTVLVSRAFGHFKAIENGETQVWIASGVGITPFLAWLGKSSTAKVVFYYSYKGTTQAPHLAELEQLCNTRENLELITVDTTVRTRLTAEEIANKLAALLVTSRVYYCGPKAMRVSIQQGLNERGLRHNRFHFEEFELRSGVELQWLVKILKNPLRWLWLRVKKRLPYS